MLQIVFNEISAAELSQLGTLEQLELLQSFQVNESVLAKLKKADTGTKEGEDAPFGVIDRDGKSLYRYRAGESRIYFEVMEGVVVVHRVLHRNSVADFLYRSRMPVPEDQALSESKHFWKLIDEGRKAQRL